jgi:hypothetical protein
LKLVDPDENDPGRVLGQGTGRVEPLDLAGLPPAPPWSLRSPRPAAAGDAASRAAAASSWIAASIRARRSGETGPASASLASSCSTSNSSISDAIPRRSGCGIAAANEPSISIATSRSRRSPRASARS